jgi:beta-lactamase class A
LACEAQRAAERAVEKFVAGDPGRSVAVRGAGVEVAVRADRVRPAASLVKLALVSAVRAAPDVELSARVRRDELGTTVYSSVLDVLEPGHEFTIGELCGLCLALSDNPASDYLLGLVGKDAVNERAGALGAVDTRIETGFSDPELGSRANVTTAADALALVIHSVREDEVALSNSLRNTRIPLRLPDETRVAHKTGTLEGVVNDAGVIFGETDLALAFLCEDQADPALTSIEIGDCVAQLFNAK